MEEFEFCGGVVIESDRRAVLLKKLPPGVHTVQFSREKLAQVQVLSGYEE